MTSISKDCPCNECDGSGYLIYRAYSESNKSYYDFAEPCKCLNGIEKSSRKEYSNIPKMYANSSVRDFNINFYKDREGASKVKSIAKNFIVRFDEFQRMGKGLYLYSQTKGSGKTYLACAIGNALIETKGIGVKFMSTLELLLTIKDTYKKDSEASEKDALNSIKQCPVLILDDIGAERATNWVNSIFLNILDYRIENELVTLFTSNTAIESLKLDERIVNRIYKMAIEIQMPEESVRKSKSEKENSEIIKMLLEGKEKRNDNT